MPTLVLDRNDLISFFEKARCPLDPSFSALFFSYRNDILAGLRRLSSDVLHLSSPAHTVTAQMGALSLSNNNVGTGHSSSPTQHNVAPSSHSNAGSTTSSQQQTSAPWSLNVSPHRCITTDSSLPPHAASHGSTASLSPPQQPIIEAWSDNVYGHTYNSAPPHGPASNASTQVSQDGSTAFSTHDVNDAQSFWTSIGIDFNTPAPALPPLSNVIAPRMDSNEDLFDWGILVDLVVSRPEGFQVDQIWRAFTDAYAQAAAYRKRAPWSTVYKRYKCRSSGSRLICDFSTVVCFHNCMVRVGIKSYKAGIYIPVTNTPYHLIRQPPMCWNDETRVFE
ncbi:hypothetical protein OC844_004216 [Tilletia horrida]|nr:hypothetical protein OC844_004216 [Tilletia horrida]